jgi:hypothetical protein
MGSLIYEQLEKLSSPFIEGYWDDLLVHDKNTLETWPTTRFVHWTRNYGTYIVMMPLWNDECYPPDGQRVPYLFGTADRYHILDEKLNQAKYMTKHEGLRLTMYFDGKGLYEISAQRGVDFILEYTEGIRNDWKASDRLGNSPSYYRKKYAFP